jgi:hypothetical protein
MSEPEWTIQVEATRRGYEVVLHAREYSRARSMLVMGGEDRERWGYRYWPHRTLWSARRRAKRVERTMRRQLEASRRREGAAGREQRRAA